MSTPASTRWRGACTPASKVGTHRHLGAVHMFTLSGSWVYLEHDFVNRAGSYLYEPPGSVHTLYVPADNTEVTETLTVVYGRTEYIGERRRGDRGVRHGVEPRDVLRELRSGGRPTPERDPEVTTRHQGEPCEDSRTRLLSSRAADPASARPPRCASPRKASR